MTTASAATPPSNDLDVLELSADLSEAVQQVKEIQVLVTSFIDTIVVRKNDETEKETLTIKATIKQVHAIRVKLDKLGSKYAKLRLNNIHAVPLGNTGYVSLDPTEEQSGFYKQLLECYTWLRNLDCDTTRTLDILKRKCPYDDDSDVKEFKSSETTIQDLLSNMKTSFPSLYFNDSLISSECCLEVNIPESFAVYIFFSGLTISHAIAKSLTERYTLEPWEVSEHYVYKKLTDVFVSVILRLIQKDPSVICKEFLTYISGYKDFFTVKCKSCQKHLCSDSDWSRLLPPVWKDMNSDSFYHLSCRPL